MALAEGLTDWLRGVETEEGEVASIVVAELLLTWRKRMKAQTEES